MWNGLSRAHQGACSRYIAIWLITLTIQPDSILGILSCDTNVCETMWGSSRRDSDTRPTREPSIKEDTMDCNKQQALVLYDETKVAPMHHTERTFMFAGQRVAIKQNWADVGIAAVVWEAVCYLNCMASLIKIYDRIYQFSNGPI